MEECRGRSAQVVRTEVFELESFALRGFANVTEKLVEGRSRHGAARVVATGENIGARFCKCLQRNKKIESLIGERHDVRRALFHAVGGDGPKSALEVDLIPCRMSQLALAHEGEEKKLRGRFDLYVGSNATEAVKRSLDLFGGKVALARFEACDRGWRYEPGDVLELGAASSGPIEDAHANVSTVDRDGRSSALDDAIEEVTQAVFGDFGEK